MHEYETETEREITEANDDLITEMEDQRQRGYEALQYLQNRQNRHIIGKGYKWAGAKDWNLELDEFFLFRVSEVTFEEKAPRKEAMENILGTFRGMDGISFVYMILGDAFGVKFYFGVAWDKSYPESKLPFSIFDLEVDILTPSMRGNFRGSKLTEVDPAEKKSILDRLNNARAVGMLEGVPGVDEMIEEKKEDFQGTDRLIDVMMGDEFGFVVIATPYTDAEVDKTEAELYALNDALAPWARHTMQGAKDCTINHNINTTFSDTRQTESNIQYSKNASHTANNVKSTDHRCDNLNQIQSLASKTAGDQWSKENHYSKGSTNVDSHGSSSSRNEERTDESGSHGSNESYSTQNQSSYTYMMSTTETKSGTSSNTESHGSSKNATKGKTQSISKNESLADGSAQSQHISISEQMEVEVKSAADWLDYLDKILFPRLDHGRGKGLFHCCSYLFAKQRTALYRLANTAISLYSGPKGNKAALFFTDLTDAKDDAGCLHALKNLQIPAAICDEEDMSTCYAVGFSRSERKSFSYCGSWMSANELGLLTGLPQKEVIGLRLREEVEFGLNVEPVPKKERIKLGHLVQSGEEKKIPVYLNKKDLDKHTFITGVTGSGKTTTCQNILLDCGLPFLVIEPAKTEYRSMLRNEKSSDIVFFTPGRQDVAPFFLNPFELFPGEAITSRADMLKATFEASFEMEAAIPQIMEAAIYQAYESKGWHIGTNCWKDKDETDKKNGPFADGVYAFPTLTDFVAAVKVVIERQGFDARLKNDYLGSINARIEGLMVGAKGQMLNTVRSIDFSNLVHQKVVIELEEIRSSAEKSLLMGFILTNLLQAVRRCHSENKEFQHITLVEEAHRLLSRYMPGDSLNKKQGVEVFTDMLAEVRKYGESLIIVDQIPDKMTPEVLKNTNTKIVHKLFAQDDKDAIGNTMALDDEQKSFLSNLAPGRAVMFSQGWTKAVQIQVDEKTDQADVEPQKIRDTSLQYYFRPENVRRGILQGLERLKNIDKKTLEDYLFLLQSSDTWINIFQEYIRKESAGKSDSEADVTKFKEFSGHVRQAIHRCGTEMVLAYWLSVVYENQDEGRGEILRNLIKVIESNNDEVRNGIYIINKFHIELKK